MSNYNSLKTTIDANIKQNGRQEITGQILNSVLNQMVTTLGAGYQFAGVATTATNPGSPDAKVFYIANGKGAYTNFGGLIVDEDEVVLLTYDDTWKKVSSGIASNKYVDNIKKNIDCYPLINGKYYQYDSTTNKVSLTNLSTISCAIVSTKVGDIWHIKTQGTGVAYPYYVVDSEYNVLQKDSYTEEPINQKVEVTSEDSAFIIVNCINTQLVNYAFYSELSVRQNRQYIKELQTGISKINGGFYNLCLFDQNSYIAIKENDGIKLKFNGSIYEQNKFVFYTPDMRFFKLQATNDELFFDLSGNTLIYVKESEIGHNQFIDAKIVSVYNSNWPSLSDSVDYIPIAISYNGNIQFNFLLGSILRDTYISDNTQEITHIKEALSNYPTGVKTYFPQEPKYGKLLIEKCPNFYQKMKLKNSDVTVVLTGTSLTQGNLYATTRSDATTRPPLLHTNDLASAVFDKLINNWCGQQYRRYDHPDLQYTNGEWLITNDLVINETHIWDDEGSDRNGLTKTTTNSNAGVSIKVPADAWQFNFIYRSDSQCGLCSVSIQEGDGKMEAFNGSEWVEANGYQFSMLESTTTSTKGNTCYQKRLKMRCKNKASGGINSIGTEKTITISKGNDSSRFNVVGFEWSPREFMFTLINAARGSHQWGMSGNFNLEKYQDNDIWIFNPDLILAEVTIINWGASSADGLTRDPLFFVNNAKRAYFNEFGDDQDSIYETSEHWSKCEVLFYGDTVSGATVYNECWDENGNPKFGVVTTSADNGDSVSTINLGKVKTIFENYDAVDNYMCTKGFIYIPVTRVFKSVAEKCYGAYRLGFTGSGKDGATLSIDGTHLNDNGAALWALLICPVFDVF